MCQAYRGTCFSRIPVRAAKPEEGTATDFPFRYSVFCIEDQVFQTVCPKSGIIRTHFRHVAISALDVPEKLQRNWL
jgi:hypothetical protein